VKQQIIILLLLATAAGSCRKAAPTVKPVNRIIGIYEGTDSFVYREYTVGYVQDHYDRRWSNVTFLADTVTRLTDSSFRISFPKPDGAFPDQVHFDGSFNYHVQGYDGYNSWGNYRNITFYPDQDSMVIEQEVRINNIRISPTNQTHAGYVQSYYHLFRGKKD